MIKKLTIVFAIVATIASCKNENTTKDKNDVAVNTENKAVKAPFNWRSANLYFLLTDRFNNGDKSNDVNFNRNKETATLRGFEGGDLKGIIQKINDGYFNDLGVNAIWMTPVFEQVHGATDEGTGNTYAFHGYWTKDWTTLDPNFGTKADLKELIKVAHKNGIRILLDAVVNHTGPVTETDTKWPTDWVRDNPQCTYKGYDTTIPCTLVKNLPDVLTESNNEVELPPQLIEKWKKEGRYDSEVESLNKFFEATGYPRAPRFYIMKWLADYISNFGIDGYRVDTVKHVEEGVWQEFKDICDKNYSIFKTEHPNSFLDDDFFLVGEVYNYGISVGQIFDFGDKKVNYFDDAFNSLINFDFKWNAQQMDYETLFSTYNKTLQGELKDYGVLNYITSHDDGQPFDVERTKTYEGATKLLLCPGTSQLYYGDETARPLKIEGATGDANLRSVMNWNDIKNKNTKALLTHYQKLGQFRKQHLSVGAGVHNMINTSPYYFSRTYNENGLEDKVIVGLDLPKGKKDIKVNSVFKDADVLHDAYSNQDVKVVDGVATVTSDFDIVLLEKK